MKILDTKAGKQLVAKVGKRKAIKMIRQNMFSQSVENRYGQRLAVGEKMRKIQTRQISGPGGRSTPGITDNLRYGDLSKKNPRLAQAMGESFGAPLGVDRPSTPEQGQEGVMGSMRDTIRKEIQKRSKN